METILHIVLKVSIALVWDEKRAQILVKWQKMKNDEEMEEEQNNNKNYDDDRKKKSKKKRAKNKIQHP